MLDALNITEEDALGLAELAQHDLALARDFARRAQAAEDGDEASRLARSYQRAARSYRQTLALKARLKRDLAVAAAMDARTHAAIPKPRPGGAAIARRIGDLRTALLRLAWDETERPEDENDAARFAEAAETFAWRRLDIEEVVTEACLKPDFSDAALNDDVAQLALRLGFTPQAIARWPDLPDPPPAALAVDVDEDDLDWRSSA